MAKLKSKKELLIGVLFLVIGIAYLISAFFIPSYEGYGGQNISSSFLPKVLGIILVLLSILQILGAHKADTAAKTEEPKKIAVEKETNAGGATMKNLEEFDDDAAMRGASTKSMLITFSILVIYIALMPIVGFILSTAFFLLSSMLVLTPSSKRNLVLILALTCIVSVGVYFLFVNGLSLVLPAGILGIG